MSWQRLLYDLGLLALLPVVGPIYAVKRGRGLKGGWERLRLSLAQRMGRLPDDLPQGSTVPLVWVHAVSVGEAAASRPLIEGLKKAFPGIQVVVSTVTETGQDVAARLPHVDGTFYLPLDLTALTGRAIERLRPSLLVVLETEIWPGLFWSAAEADLPIVVVNGRISDRSAGRYAKSSFFFRSVFACVTRILAQTETDRERFIAAGAPSESVQVAGNIKFDGIGLQDVGAARATWRARLGLGEDERLWVAGSTFAGEEAMLADVYRRLRTSHPNLRLLIAPRHVERTSEVLETLRGKGLRVIRRTELGESAPDSDAVLLLDTTGELARLYAAADMVFMGKSLCDVASGGQNPLEPAALGLPVCFGPRMENFRAIVERLLDARAAVCVLDASELQECVETWLERPERRMETGRRAAEYVESQRGATERILEALKELLSRNLG